MKDIRVPTKIEVRVTEGRRGVFCTEDLKEGEMIEEAPLVLLDNNKWEECDSNLLKYLFPWGELRDDWQEFCEEHGGILPIHATRPVAVLGYGMIYNRRAEYNVDFKLEKKLFACQFIAKCDIKEGEELILAKNDISDERQSP